MTQTMLDCVSSEGEIGKIGFELPADLAGSLPERSAALLLGSYVLTCRKQNTDEWMAGLADTLNELCRRLGDPARYRYDGDGIVRR